MMSWYDWSVSPLLLTQRMRRAHPEWPALAAWVGAWCMAVSAAVRGNGAHEHLITNTRSALLGWFLMVIMMMTPTVLGAVRHVAISSYVWRRGRAMAEFATGYLLVWMIIGVLVLALFALFDLAPSWMLTAIVLVWAAIWQVTPFKQNALRACHRSTGLPATGWPAERGAVMFGIHQGVSCVGSCWALMLVTLCMPAASLFCCAAIGAMTTVERVHDRPRHVTKRNAVALVLFAVFALIPMAR